METQPLLVGITGGIGSGKSIVCRMFKLLGVPVYDADSRAKALMAESPVIKSKLIDAFGKDVFDESGKLNRPYLANLAFSDPKQTEILNGIVHPEVKTDTERWIKENAQAPYVLKEAALLFESGAYKSLDFIITVFAPTNLRIHRVLLRDPQRSRLDVENIMNNQWPDERKKELSQAIITNDESRLLIPQILKLHTKLMERRNNKS